MKLAEAHASGDHFTKKNLRCPECQKDLEWMDSITPPNN